MNKEYIYDLLNRLDLQEWCTELYKVPLTWCELYDIRDYIINLEQQIKKQKEVIDRLNFIKNRKNQGASQENINKMAIEFVNSWLNEVSK